MAVLGKIRSKGVTLICVIGFALFAFIAEEAFRSCESSRNNARQQVAKILDKKVDYQEYQKLIEEAEENYKARSGRENLTDDEQQQVRDQAWQQFVNSTLFNDQAEKVGLTVTDEEMQNLFTQGTNPMVIQAGQQMGFVNQQTGRFDVSLLRKFIDDYNKNKTSNSPMAAQYKAVYDRWTQTEHQLREGLLMNKMQVLFTSCLLSNDVEAKMAFNDEKTESEALVAFLGYNSVNDNEVKPTEAELKAKYDEVKAGFYTTSETRDIKYVDVQVTASAADRKALDANFKNYLKEVQEAEAAELGRVVNSTASTIPFINLPRSKEAFPMDIAARLDSMSVGQTLGPVENKDDNSLNIIRLVSKEQVPDSVQYCMIQVVDQDINKVQTRADSIMNALNGGGDFAAIAKKYGQQGDSLWFVGQNYESATSIPMDMMDMIQTLLTLNPGEVKNVKMSQGNAIIKVLDRKAMKDKFIAAVVKKSIDFSKDTYNTAYNKFSEFVTKSSTLKELEANAKKYGYTVQEQKNVVANQHVLANIKRSHEAMKWAFDEAKEDKVSPLYECGDNADHLFVFVVTKIHPKGLQDFNDPNVQELLKTLVMNDKKAEKLIAKLKGVTSIDAAKKAGCQVDTLKQVTFANNAFVQALGTQEPKLSGAISSAKKGVFSKAPIKGNAGVYVFIVTNRKEADPKQFKAAEYKQQLGMSNAQGLFQTIWQDMMQKADITDNRYLF